MHKNAFLRSPRSPSTQEIDSADESPDRILTAANLLSVARLVLVALALWLMFGPDYRVAAALVLGLAGISDFLDGYVARRFHQVSELGKLLDPTVDRMVVLASAIAIAVYGAVPVIVLAVILFREVFVAATALILAALGAGRIDVLFIGKVSTFGLFTCLPIFLGGDGPGQWAQDVTIIAWIVAVPSLVVSIVSIGFYFPLARHALAAGRESSLG